jgi:hypothetical protein
MKIHNFFELGQFVYLKTDVEQKRRIVTAIIIRPSDVLYELACGTEVSSHYNFEISDTSDIMITSNN